MVIIWTRDMDAGFLLTAVMVAIYFIVGSKLEERKLTVYYGGVYRHHMERAQACSSFPGVF